MINEVYISKEKYDARCIENHLPKETMEQHLFNFMNHKYGLKSLIIEWSNTFITAISKYANDDNDVA